MAEDRVIFTVQCDKREECQFFCHHRSEHEFNKAEGTAPECNVGCLLGGRCRPSQRWQEEFKKVGELMRSGDTEALLNYMMTDLEVRAQEAARRSGSRKMS